MPDKPIMNNYTARVTKMETLVYLLCNLVQFRMHMEIKCTSTWQQRTSLTVYAHAVISWAGYYASQCVFNVDLYYHAAYSTIKHLLERQWLHCCEVITIASANLMKVITVMHLFKKESDGPTYMPSHVALWAEATGPSILAFLQHRYLNTFHLKT